MSTLPVRPPLSGLAPSPDPRRVYAERREARRREEARGETRHQRVANARLIVFLGFLALLGFILWARSISVLWLGLPIVLYVPLVVLHEQVLERRNRSARAAALYERGLDRLDDRWAGVGPDGARFLDPEHLYAADLDLFGSGSLFQLLCRASTRAGEETLAAWLTTPAAPEVVRARQEAVRELAENLDFREDLALLGAKVEAGLHPVRLTAWAVGPPPAGGGTPGRVVPLLALFLGAAAAPALIGWIAWGIGPSPLAAVLMAQVFLRMRLRRAVAAVAAHADDSVSDLGLLGAALERIEREPFTAPRLRALRAELDTGGRPPSRRIHHLRLLVDCFEGRRNGLFAPIAFLLLWDVHFAFAIEAWRRAWGAAVPRWVAVTGEFEALASLAWGAFERPGDVYPELREVGDERPEAGGLTARGSARDGDDRGCTPCFDGDALGHPLLPAESCVRNDLRLDAGRPLLVVSGSNMSGKSTLLRTAGLAAVLAQAGAPVRARRLVLSPVSIGASIRIQDSLHGGVSRFYAEISRLRRIVEAAERGPVLFLIDELLGGTNSHDRRIGAEGVLRTLVERGAIGMATTHDLALTAVADALDPRAGNVHFEDRLVEGRIAFDYRLHPGVVTRSNALELMRAVGLPVEGAERRWGEEGAFPADPSDRSL